MAWCALGTAIVIGLSLGTLVSAQDRSAASPGESVVYIGLSHEDEAVVWQSTEAPARSFSRSFRGEGRDYAASVEVADGRIGAVLTRDGRAFLRIDPQVLVEASCGSVTDPLTHVRFVLGVGPTATAARTLCGNGDSFPPRNTRRTTAVREYIASLASSSIDAAYESIDAGSLSREDWERAADPTRWDRAVVHETIEVDAPAGGRATVRVSFCLRERETGLFHAYTDVVPIVVVDHRFRLLFPPGPRPDRAADAIGDACARPSF